MKFLYIIFNIICITKVLCNTSNDQNISGVDCYKSLKEMVDYCFPSNDSLSLKNLDNTCKNYNDAKCQAFVKDPLTSLNNCANVNNLNVGKIKDYVEDVSDAFMISCQKNEKGEYCPLSKLELYKIIDLEKVTSDYYSLNIPSKEEYTKAIEESCQSKNCYDAYYKYYSKYYRTEDKESLKKDAENTSDKISSYEINGYLILLEDSCKLKSNSITQESGATKNRVFSLLIVVMTLFFLF